MAGKYGGVSTWLLVDGYNLITTKPKTLRHKIEAVTEDTMGLGDAAGEATPTGTVKFELEQGGALFDTATNGGHDALAAKVPTSPQATPRIVCLGFAGQVMGAMFYGLSSLFTAAYEVLAQSALLTKANVSYVANGQVDLGEIVQPLAAQTVDWNTKTLGTRVDSGAGTSNGAIGYLQVTALSGFTGFIGKIRDSADDSTYADLITFDNVTSAPTAQRKTVAGTVDRYLSFDGNVTGTGSITVFAGLSRTPA